MDGFNSRNVHFGLSAEQDGETGDTVSFLQSKEGDGSESFTNPIPGNIRSAAQTLSYTCILVPCSPSLQLLGDLANHLGAFHLSYEVVTQPKVTGCVWNGEL